MRRRVAGLGQIGCPGLEFERGWHWEHERGAGNRSRVAARAKAGGAELATAHGGPTATESSPDGLWLNNLFKLAINALNSR